LLGTLPTSAATASNGTNSNSAATHGDFDPAKGGHVGDNNKTEQLLTGDSAEKVKPQRLQLIPAVQSSV
jgi:hypothetical protein